MNWRDLIKHPVVTERSTQLKALQQYVFAVDTRASKGQVREAMKLAFGVDVLAVRTMIVRGKTKRRGNARAGQLPDWKKAIVTIKPGQEIKLGEEAK